MNKDKVFVLVDNYEDFHPIVPYSVHLAKALKNPAVLFSIIKADYTVQPTVITGSGVPYPPTLKVQDLKKKAEPFFKKLIYQAKAIWPEVSYDLEIGFPEDKTLQMINERGARLLVLEGKSDFSTINEWIGTYETRIAEESDCPALVVPNDFMWQPVNKILYMMDVKDTKIKNLRILSEVATALDAHVQIVMISEKPDVADITLQNLIETFRDLMGHDKLTFHRVYGNQRAAEVKRIVQETRPDWLTIEQKNKNFFERLFDNYNTKRLILQSDIPVFVF